MSLDSKLDDAQSMTSKTQTSDCWLERIFVQFQECTWKGGRWTILFQISLSNQDLSLGEERKPRDLNWEMEESW